MCLAHHELESKFIIIIIVDIIIINIYGVCRMQEFSRLADDMMQGRPTESGPTPPNMIKNQWSFLPPVIIDTAPIGETSPPPSPHPNPPPPPFSCPFAHHAAALKTGSVSPCI